MSRNFYKPLVWLMWLALPITALKYWHAWDHLPVRMAVLIASLATVEDIEFRPSKLFHIAGAMNLIA